MQKIFFKDCSIQTINIQYYQGGEVMSQEKAIPGDIGDFIDENSLARKLLIQIDNVKDKMALLAETLESYEADDGSLEGLALSGMKLICEGMVDELVDAHSMICDPRHRQKKASEIPTTDTPEA